MNQLKTNFRGSNLPNIFNDYTFTVTNEKPKLGRNEICHCGSGKKYKKCCLDKDSGNFRERISKNMEDAVLTWEEYWSDKDY